MRSRDTIPCPLSKLILKSIIADATVIIDVLISSAAEEILDALAVDSSEAAATVPECPFTDCALPAQSSQKS
jgi:hypothetical protein